MERNHKGPTGNQPPAGVVAHGIAREAADWLDNVVGPSLRAQADVAKTILTIGSAAMALSITVAGPIQAQVVGAPYARDCLMVGLILFAATVLTSVLCLVSLAAFADFRPSLHAISQEMVDRFAEHPDRVTELKESVREKIEVVRKKGVRSLTRGHYLLLVSVWCVVGAFLSLVVSAVSIYSH